MPSYIDTINNMPTLQETVKRTNLAPKKALGQNFLFDLNITQKIVKLAHPTTSGTVIEIGPGPGGLTRAILLSGADDVIAIEMDTRAEVALAELSENSQGRLQVIQGDATEISVNTLGNSPRQVIANLPYNVGTHLLLQWLQSPNDFTCFTLMFQKEVAQRITAKIGDKHYGRLAILCNVLCQTQIVMHISPKAFTPPPKVDSAVVRLVPYDKPLHDCNIKSLEIITKTAFNQRRKMLRQSLKPVNCDVQELLRLADIEPTKRAEHCTIEEFCKMAQVYDTLKDI